MSSSASCPSPTRRPLASPTPSRRRLSLGAKPARPRKRLLTGRPIASYLDEGSRRRELLTLPGYGGSVLVLDRDATTLCDRRLVAHLAVDEPEENAALVCGLYMEDVGGRWCRRLQPEDLLIDPLAGDPHGAATLDRLGFAGGVVDDNGDVYSIDLLPGERSTAQLRWCRRPPRGANLPAERVALRDVIAAFESYEPMRTLTESAIAGHRGAPDLVVTRLRHEYERLCESPVVLNRGLREAVLHAIDRRGLSMGEIAFRCGMVKRDRRGKTSGETSWVARRIGLMPEGGEKAITPWVHVDVLATIARKGLGVSPREVELQ
jgi:hypothetical protein